MTMTYEEQGPDSEHLVFSIAGFKEAYPQYRRE